MAIVDPCLTSQKEQEYRAWRRLSALAGNPMCCKVVNINSWDMDGKADAKSKSMQAPSDCVREEIMELVSSCSRLVRMERPRKKPCCRGRIQWERWHSQRFRAAEAIRRLSLFTILRGRVLLRVYAFVPSVVVEVLFLGRHTRMLWLKRWSFEASVPL